MTVSCEKFAFDISHKGGIGETRNTKLNINDLKADMLIYKNQVYDISNNKIALI